VTVHVNGASQHGIQLAERLGLTITKREGHDLAGPCVACKSSDAFRLHQQAGVAQCYSCGAKWSPFSLAEHVLGDRDQAKRILVEAGIFKDDNPVASNGQALDPIGDIARQKSISKESLAAFGARATGTKRISLPCYGPDGRHCTWFNMSTSGGKGLFDKGKPAGLFFPHQGEAVRLPEAGEMWHLVEGVKDAAALHGLGYNACGLNTCRLAAKFARLFADVEVVLVPDRDAAGEEGAQHSARVLRGVAASIQIAALPAEFKESDGPDVRDVLKQKDGEQLLRQCLDDAAPVNDGQQEKSSPVATEGIELPQGDTLLLTVSPAGRQPQRTVEAKRGDVVHRDRLNTDSAISRGRFVKKLAAKLDMKIATLEPLVDERLSKLAEEVDANRGAGDDHGEEESQSTFAAKMADDWDMWHTPAPDAYATVPANAHLESWPVRSTMFKRFVLKRFFEEEGKAMGSDALTAAINVMEANALFDGDEHDVHLRVAEHDGNIYVDLCNDEWQVVEITPTGWQVIDESPVRFRRSKGMLPLPIPERGGTVMQLRSFLNVDDTSWKLIVGWLVAALRPRGPYPLLARMALNRRKFVSGWDLIEVDKKGPLVGSLWAFPEDRSSP